MVQENLAEQLLPIYGVWHLPFWQTRWFLVICGLLIVLLVFVASVYIARRLKRREKKIIPWEYAREQFKSLEGVEITKESGKKIYAHMIEVIKKYLTLRFGWDLVGLTDFEVIEFLQKQELDPIVVTQIKEIFAGAITVKFANEAAVKELLTTHIQHAHSIIERTIPKKNK